MHFSIHNIYNFNRRKPQADLVGPFQICLEKNQSLLGSNQIGWTPQLLAYRLYLTLWFADTNSHMNWLLAGTQPWHCLIMFLAKFALKFLIGIANPLYNVLHTYIIYIHSNDFEDMQEQAQKWTILFCTVHHSLFTYYSACVTKFKTLFWCFAFSIYTFHFETGTNSIKNSSLCFVGFAIFARLTYLLPGRPW